VRLIVNLSLVFWLFFIVGCTSQQPKPAPSWIETVEGIRKEARALNPSLVLDTIMVSSLGDYLADTNTLDTLVSLVNPDTAALFEASFEHGQTATPIRESGVSSVQNKDADALFSLVRIAPNDALLTANTQLPQYPDKDKGAISFFLVLDSGNGVPENLRSTTKVAWKVRYNARGTQTAFFVWVDAQTGSVVQTRVEEFN